MCSIETQYFFTTLQILDEQMNEPPAFEQLFRMHYDGLCQYALVVLKDRAAAEDVVQSLFEKLWKNGDWKKIEKPAAYLVRATKFRCIDHMRREAKHRHIDINSAHAIIAEETIASTDDLAAQLAFVINKLPEKTRQVFLLSRQGGLTYREIAAELKISPKTVEHQMGRALRMLRERIKSLRSQ